MITLKDIHKTYRIDSRTSLEALKGINLEINRGEIFGVIGLSGAGKSTLIRVINLLERPTRGTVIVDGQELTGLGARALGRARRSIGMIFQQFNLLSSMTVFDNVSFPLELDGGSGKDRGKRVLELLEMVGLADKAEVYPAQLSGGQKQRVGIARALASNPKVLLCDEATSALDPKTTSAILRLLMDLRTRLGLTIVIITHQMEVIKECCDRVALLDEGVITEIGTTLEIFGNPAQPLTRRLVDAAIRRDVSDLLAGADLHREYAPGDRAWAELLFLGERANDPVLVEVARETGAVISILGGSINHIQDQPLGVLIAAVSGSEAEIARTLAAFGRRVYKAGIIGYEREGGRC